MGDGILCLPEELLLRTLKHIQDEGRVPALYNSTLVSKQMNRLATPLLYSDITIDLDGRDFEVNMEMEQYAAPLAQLVRQLLRSPQHAAMVRTFNLRRFLDDYPSPPDLFLDVEDAVRSKLAILLPDEEKQSAWQEELLNSERRALADDCWILFGIICMSNLQRLQLVPGLPLDDERSIPLLKDVLDSNDLALREPETKQSRVWPCLNEAFIEGMGDKYPGPTKHLALFARIPGLKHLKGSELGDEEDDDISAADPAFLSLRPKSSSVERISLLKGCKLNTHNMSRLLEGPKALKYFEYEFGHSWAWVPFATSELERALLCQKDSLQELILRLSDRDFFEFPSPQSEVDPMDFTSFTSLEKLTIEPALIFGLRIALIDTRHSDDPEAGDCPGVEETKRSLMMMLPQGLKDLTIQLHGGHESGSRLATALHMLLTHEGHENLATVKILAHADRVEGYREQMTTVEQAAASVGIDFSVQERNAELWPIDPPL